MSTSCSCTYRRTPPWLNQIEFYFSILTRKALTPATLPRHKDLAERILAFQHEFAQAATWFDWTFTRRDLNALLDRLRPTRPAGPGRMNVLP